MSLKNTSNNSLKSELDKVLINKNLYVLPKPKGDVSWKPERLQNVLRNTAVKLFEFGFAIHEDSLNLLGNYSPNELRVIISDLLTELKQIKGSNVTHISLYPNYPESIYSLTADEFMYHAIMHYQHGLYPEMSFDDTKLPFNEKTKVFKLKLISMSDKQNVLYGYVSDLISARFPITINEQSAIKEYVSVYGLSNLPQTPVVMKETFAFLLSLVKDDANRLSFIKSWLGKVTATDILRFATIISDGDETLSTNTKFSIPRRYRRDIAELSEESLNRSEQSFLEDLVRHDSKWVKLAEVIHPGDRLYKNKYPKFLKAITKLRNQSTKKEIITFNSKLTLALSNKDLNTSVELLKSRPGEFARRLDHMVRLFGDTKTGLETVLNGFKSISDKVSNGVLLQLLQHFRNRQLPAKTRTFKIKSRLASMKTIDNNLKAINKDIVADVEKTILDSLRLKYSKLEPLGKVYIDESFKNFTIPESNRSASSGFKVLGRGSKIKLEDGNKLRLFTHWFNMDGGGYDDRVDIDSALLLYDNKFKYTEDYSWHNYSSQLKNAQAVTFSGDITNAPRPYGATEFFDINIDLVKKIHPNSRYIVHNINTYTVHDFSQLDAVSGFMIRDNMLKGEVFEPRAVNTVFELSAKTRSITTIIVDIDAREIYWVDSAASISGAVASDYTDATESLLRFVIERPKMSVHELAMLHATSRGELVDNRDDADFVFAEDGDITPYDSEKFGVLIG